MFVHSGVALPGYPTRRCAVRRQIARRILMADASRRRPSYFSGDSVPQLHEHYWNRVFCSSVCKTIVTPSNEEEMQERGKKAKHQLPNILLWASFWDPFRVRKSMFGRFGSFGDHLGHHLGLPGPPGSQKN